MITSTPDIPFSPPAPFEGITPDSAVALYESACQALAEAKTLIEVKEVRDRTKAIAEYGRLAKDRTLHIQATELMVRAEYKLGTILAATPRNVGGRPEKTRSEKEQVSKPLEEMGIDRKLSSRAQKFASISERAIEARIAAWRERAERSSGRLTAKDILRDAPINGARATMAGRIEPDDSLDYFPTPPWATRALAEHVMPQFGLIGCPFNHVWEPACGEGHMAEVLHEYTRSGVYATDVHDYGYGRTLDFLHGDHDEFPVLDWIITNPPFAPATDFVRRALDLAQIGVAMFVRTQFLESIDRYERIFKPHRPTLIAFFAERVNLCKGRWEPDGSTATAYCWLVWIKGEEPMPPFWIPPGCREFLTRPDDVERFTAHPVKCACADPQPESGGAPGPSTLAVEGLTSASVSRRGEPEASIDERRNPVEAAR
jgi:hypothetical protein